MPNSGKYTRKPRAVTYLQVEEMRRRAAEGESGYRIGKALGIAPSTVAWYIPHKSGKLGPWVSEPKRCDICAIEAGPRVKVLRFGLQHWIRVNGSNRGAGAIDLCSQCYEETAGKRRRPRKPISDVSQRHYKVSKTLDNVA